MFILQFSHFIISVANTSEIKDVGSIILIQCVFVQLCSFKAGVNHILPLHSIFVTFKTW